MTGPPGRRVLRFDGRFASEGCGIAIGAALRLGFRGFRRFKGFRGEGNARMAGVIFICRLTAALAVGTLTMKRAPHFIKP